MSKLKVTKDCIYCKKKVAHMIVLADATGDSHVHAPFENRPWINFLVGCLSNKLNAIRNESTAMKKPVKRNKKKGK